MQPRWASNQVQLGANNTLLFVPCSIQWLPTHCSQLAASWLPAGILMAAKQLGHIISIPHTTSSILNYTYYTVE